MASITLDQLIERAEAARSAADEASRAASRAASEAHEANRKASTAFNELDLLSKALVAINNSEVDLDLGEHKSPQDEGGSGA